MKVFLSAYACEPGKGSEPGVGWRWTVGLSERVALTVLTREDNRRAIDEALAKQPQRSPLRRVTFLYHDLPAPFIRAKRRRLLPTLAYYALWQWSVARKFGTVADQSDVVHHLTFCTLLCPGFWKLKRAAFVLGPVGAPLVNPHYLPLFGGKAWIQRLRGWIMRSFPRLPWLRRLLQEAAAIIPANSETRQLLQSHGIPTKEVILDTGAPDVTSNVRREMESGKLRLMYAGQLERRKGLELALRALAQVSRNDGCDWTFDVFGTGPDLTRLRALAEELNIAMPVRFHGAVAHEALMSRFDDADVFLFTSVRDTSGSVNLEAMAHGLPVVCIAHQGVGDITTDRCALRVRPGEIAETINGLARALSVIIGDRRLRENLGREARRRALEDFPWDRKFEAMTRYYAEACESAAGRVRSHDHEMEN